MKAPGLQLRVLGELGVFRGAEHVALPPSKKTRALLAYLAVTGRSHRRDRLCSLLWDVADDPRGALRWSLSKIRAVLDEPGTKRLVADRGSVSFEPKGAAVDVLEVRRACADGVESVSTGRLEELARLHGGELLESLDLPDFHDFQAWCVAEREQARKLRSQILRELVRRLDADPARAVPWAHELVQIQPLDEPSRAHLVRLLGQAGRRLEAEQQYQSGSRLLRELGSRGTGELLEAWREVDGARVPASAPAPEPEPSPAPAAPPPVLDPDASSLVGRVEEQRRLAATLDEVGRASRERVVLLAGEPGAGKTRLLGELASRVRARGGTVLEGGAYEAESGRPYGPWIDAMRGLHAMGEPLDVRLAPLLPELGAADAQGSREKLFGAVVELLAARARTAAPVLLVLDDVQWLDEASAELLHYVARLSRHQPLLVLLAARDGELPDNEPMLRLVRGLRRERLLEEMAVGPLGPEETAELVRRIEPAADPQRVFERCAGNPLFALELARALRERTDETPHTLGEIVRDRVDRLPPEAADLLRWAAVLGQTFGADRLEALTSLEPTAFVSALEALERHALIQPARAAVDAGSIYAFAHDVVRHSVHTEMSEPRRRLMHLRVAQILDGRPDPDGALAADLAHHADLAGEAALAARACVAAGRRCLRVFASAEAEALARRGMRHADALPGAERVERLLELADISFSARRPTEPEKLASQIESLAREALALGLGAHARLGFHMLSYLRWEGGDWSDAQRFTLEAARVSRDGDDRQRIVAVAEAARCLAMIERDLPQAEALLLEAGGLAEQTGIEVNAIPDAVGMLRVHQGRLDEARALFGQARALARREEDHLAEFQALEHLVMLELSEGRYDEALAPCHDLVRIGDKLREGSEAPFARALSALARWATGDDKARAELDEAVGALRDADAKHRLAFAQSRAAARDLARGDIESARTRATEALVMASVLGRPSETALAHVMLARVAEADKDAEQVARHHAALGRIPPAQVSAEARREIARVMEGG